MYKPTLREKLWWWVIAKSNTTEGEQLGLFCKIVHSMLFPIKSIVYHTMNKEGYQPEEDIWLIYGLRFSGTYMRHFACGDDCLFRIVKRDDGVITIEKQETKHE